MAARSAAIRQSEITRAILGAKKAGIDVERFEIDPATGRIVIVAARPGAAEGEGANDWDTVLR